jgi:predicted deacylase
MNIKKITAIFIITGYALTDTYAVSWKKANAILHKAVKSYYNLPSSNIKWKVIGKSNWRNKIYYKEFGSGEKLTMIIGGMHGDEPAGFIAALKLAQHIKKNPSSIKNRVIIIPCVNPDGLLKGRRTNGRKVDINRNFPTATWSPDFVKEYNNPGKLPASEPETVILANAIEDYRPDIIIQMHQPFNTLYPDDKTPDELINKMSEITGLPISDDIGYATPGSLGSYKSSSGYEVSGITYELGEVDMEPDYDKVTESLIEAINYLDD